MKMSNSSIETKIENLKAKFIAEKPMVTNAATMNLSFPQIPVKNSPKHGFDNTRPQLLGQMSLTNTPNRSRKQLVLPVGRTEQSTGENDTKLQEIMKLSGILTINGKKYETSVNDMEHLGELGSGTCGLVVKMLHKPSGAVIAVKQMRRTGNTEETKRIVMDIDVVYKSYDCPFIVQCLGCFIMEAEVWICMELMSTCFDKLLKRLRAPIPEHILGKVTVATIKALWYLKEKHDLIHRDVKPSNILLNDKGHVKLCDFGISGRLVDSKAKTRSAGCAAYMAPERIDPPDPTKPDYDIRADVWSLGITLVELALGKFPYQNCNTEFEVIVRILNEMPPILPPDNNRFSPEFRSFVSLCLTKDFRNRPKYARLSEHAFFKKYEMANVAVDEWFARVKQQEHNNNLETINNKLILFPSSSSSSSFSATNVVLLNNNSSIKNGGDNIDGSSSSLSSTSSQNGSQQQPRTIGGDLKNSINQFINSTKRMLTTNNSITTSAQRKYTSPTLSPSSRDHSFNQNNTHNHHHHSVISMITSCHKNTNNTTTTTPTTNVNDDDDDVDYKVRDNGKQITITKLQQQQQHNNFSKTNDSSLLHNEMILKDLERDKARLQHALDTLEEHKQAAGTANWQMLMHSRPTTTPDNNSSRNNSSNNTITTTTTAINLLTPISNQQSSQSPHAFTRHRSPNNDDDDDYQKSLKQQLMYEENHHQSPLKSSSPYTLLYQDHTQKSSSSFLYEQNDDDHHRKSPYENYHHHQTSSSSLLSSYQNTQQLKSSSFLDNNHHHFANKSPKDDLYTATKLYPPPSDEIKRGNISEQWPSRFVSSPSPILSLHRIEAVSRLPTTRDENIIINNTSSSIQYNSNQQQQQQHPLGASSITTSPRSYSNSMVKTTPTASPFLSRKRHPNDFPSTNTTSSSSPLSTSHHIISNSSNNSSPIVLQRFFHQQCQLEQQKEEQFEKEQKLVNNDFLFKQQQQHNDNNTNTTTTTGKKRYASYIKLHLNGDQRRRNQSPDPPPRHNRSNSGRFEYFIDQRRASSESNSSLSSLSSSPLVLRKDYWTGKIEERLENGGSISPSQPNIGSPLINLSVNSTTNRRYLFQPNNISKGGGASRFIQTPPEPPPRRYGVHLDVLGGSSSVPGSPQHVRARFHYTPEPQRRLFR